jgi:hypothetical protein
MMMPFSLTDSLAEVNDKAFRTLYAEAQAAFRSTRDEADEHLGECLDCIIAECDARQAGLVAWAMENGYPDFETVLQYGNS